MLPMLTPYIPLVHLGPLLGLDLKKKRAYPQ
ncbi:protein of unknown function [Alcaligenes faecalis subsp. faecalis]|nr:protein of unknown function [Alcaligenes faecalis subsp. faecalis]